MKEYIINNKIRSMSIRVIEGLDKLGVYSKQEALNLAKDKCLDLVEISKAGDISICKVVDFGKFRFIQEKAENSVPSVKIKEIQFGVGIADNDYRIKVNHAKEFLNNGHKAKFQIKFKGRQMGHPEVGHALVQKILADLSEYAKIENVPKMSGKTVNFQLTPIKK